MRESIVDPNAKIARGYQPSVMPGTFESSRSAMNSSTHSCSIWWRANSDRRRRNAPRTGPSPGTAAPRHDHLTKPGFIRAAWMVPPFWAIGAGIVVFFRWLGNYEPTWTGS